VSSDNSKTTQYNRRQWLKRSGTVLGASLLPISISQTASAAEATATKVETAKPIGRFLTPAEYKFVDHLTETIIPAEAREEILKSSGASVQELREELTKLMGGQVGPFSIAYRYDTEGRLRQTRRRIFNEEHVIETTYNEHGDKATEVTRTRPIRSETEQSTPGARLPAYSEVRYSYQYGQHGNWTEGLVSYGSSPDGEFESSTRRRRSMTYY